MDKVFLIDGKEVIAENIKKNGDTVSFNIGGESFSFLISGNKIVHGAESVHFQGIAGHVIVGELEAMVSLKGRDHDSTEVSGSMVAPMPAKVFKVLKDEGSKVEEGDTILILEAMKMEHGISADQNGIIKKIHYKTGELVSAGALLAEIE